MKIDVDVNVTKIQTKFAHLNDNEEVKTLVHNVFAKELNPYVPMQTGILAQTPIITDKGVTYVQPYAHYQYTGIVWTKYPNNGKRCDNRLVFTTWKR